MKLKHAFWAVLAVAMAAVSCKKDGGQTASFSVTPTELSFESAGGEQTIAITATTWSISIPTDLDWVSVSEKKGTGNATVTVTVAANEKGAREGNITVKDAETGEKKPVSIKQAANANLSPIQQLLIEEIPYDASTKKTTPKVGFVNLQNVWWLAKYPKTGILTDGTACIVVYSKETEIAGAVGEKGSMTGDLDAYNYRNQITNPVFTKTGTVTVDHGTALELTQVAKTIDWAKQPVSYVHVVGNVVKSGTYYNVMITGVNAPDVSFASSTENGANYVDKDVDFYGYFTSGTNHLSVIPAGTITATEHQGGDVDPDLITISIADVATANNWQDATVYESFEWEGFTFAGSGTGDQGNNGAYAKSSNQWRFYQARKVSDTQGATLTITAPAGKEFKEIALYYDKSNTGILLDPSNNQVDTGVKTTVSGNSIWFHVGNTTEGKTNGQCRFTKFEISLK